MSRGSGFFDPQRLLWFVLGYENDSAMIAHLVCLFLLLFPGVGFAQKMGEEARACVPNGTLDPAFGPWRR